MCAEPNAPPRETWFLVDSGPCPPEWNMAWDEALLEAIAGLNAPVLRFYGWSEPAATFGYSQRFGEVARWTSLRPLLRRPTGGGLVPHDADWTYSLAFPPSHPWYRLRAQESYKQLHEWILRAFASVGIPTRLAQDQHKPAPGQCFIGAEKFDLLHGAAKIAGAAQRRNRQGLLIQGSVQPPARADRREHWQQAMCSAAAFPGPIAWMPLGHRHELTVRATELTAAKYSQRAYNERR